MMHRLPFKVVKRGDTAWYIHVIVIVSSIILALLFCGLIIYITGSDPMSAYVTLFKGAYGSFNKLTNTLIKSVPLILCGLSVSVAFKMKLVNIGAEGQMVIGALAASGVALFSNVDGPAKIILMFLAGFLAGGLWAVISILPKVYLNVNEVIVTLLMNYVAILFSDYFVYGPWRDPDGSNMPFSAPFAADARLPRLFGTNINAGFAIAVIAAVVLYFLLKYTVWGYKIKVIGEGHSVARYAGINISKSILLAMLVSGGLAGLAGFTEVSGTVGLFKSGLSNDIGYTGIIIAYLSRFNPLIVLIVSILFGGLEAGGYSMQLIGIPVQIVTMIQGAILLFVIGGSFFTRYQIVHIKTDEEALENAC